MTLACACALRTMLATALAVVASSTLRRREQVGPTENRVERRAQLVGDRRQEFVFQAARLALADEQCLALGLELLALLDLAQQALIGLLDAGDHGAERMDQFADFVLWRRNRRHGVVRFPSHVSRR